MHDDRKLALIDADRRSLVRAATRLLGPADAEDAVQDAYVRALEAEASRLNAAQAWLFAVVRNLAIDRLRRHRWMQHWLEQAQAGAAGQALASPSAEMDATLAQEAARALCLLAAHLPPADGAVVLLHEVFEASHAEIAAVAGRSEAGSRQQLRRVLSRLRQAGGGSRPELDPDQAAVFHLYLRALQGRDPQALWPMLRQPPVSASAATPRTAGTAAPQVPACGVLQSGGQPGLALTLEGVTLCVLPPGVQAARELESMPAC
ncbi:MAG: sigma-70 family RNA polymerase sigma factor [Aquabacterium sp.]|nr:MAG: sigma-70 family RNA polymerase sigma factor [Aquabacterium sp.]